MKIVGKKRDYYDSAGWYSEDVLYVRKKMDYQAEDLEKGDLENLERVFENHPQCGLERNLVIIGFCGKIYPTYFLSKTVKKHTLDLGTNFETWAYSTKEIQDFYGAKKAFPDNYPYPGRWHKTIVREYFRQWIGSDVCLNLFLNLNIPIFITERHTLSSCREVSSITVNPLLKEFKFQKIFDPYTAHQEMEMFVGGILKSKENKVLDIEDKYLITQKGFDEKYGFRKRPGGRKRGKHKPNS